MIRSAVLLALATLAASAAAAPATAATPATTPATSSPLSTVSERSGFQNTGRYAEVADLCTRFQKNHYASAFLSMGSR